jgi:D-glycerate 3-kinase
VSEAPIPALVRRLVDQTRAQNPGRPALIGVGGAQGSGKTYWCEAIAAENPRIAHFSLDDAYLTHAERKRTAASCLHYLRAIPDQLKRETWPHLEPEAFDRASAESADLFQTRGPPGTHDLALINGLIARLGEALDTSIPRFDKRMDDRAEPAAWRFFKGPAEAVLIDGWCLGALPTTEGPPLNEVERQDVLGVWRNAQQSHLTDDYAALFDRFDQIVYLQAPRFESVRGWRKEQEEKLLGRSLNEAESAALDRFIAHYERITRSMLEGVLRADWIVRLDEDRAIVQIEQRP